MSSLILDELKYVSDQFVQSAHRLAFLLLTSSRKICVYVTELFTKWYDFVYAYAPINVQEEMGGFKLFRLLKKWKSSNSLEEQLQSDVTLDEAFTAVDTSSLQGLKANCEYYMCLCSELERSNASLREHLKHQQSRLNDAVAHAFRSQLAQEREREISSLHARRIVLKVHLGDHLAQQNSQEQRPIDVHHQIENAFTMFHEVIGERLEDAVLVKDVEKHFERRVEINQNYVQRHRQLRIGTIKPLTSSSAVYMAASVEDSEFVQLVSSVKDDDDAVWYRKALQHLKEERKRRRDRVGSCASTISIID